MLTKRRETARTNVYTNKQLDSEKNKLFVETAEQREAAKCGIDYTSVRTELNRLPRTGLPSLSDCTVYKVVSVGLK